MARRKKPRNKWASFRRWLVAWCALAASGLMVYGDPSWVPVATALIAVIGGYIAVDTHAKTYLDPDTARRPDCGEG